MWPFFPRFEASFDRFVVVTDFVALRAVAWARRGRAEEEALEVVDDVVLESLVLELLVLLLLLLLERLVLVGALPLDTETTLLRPTAALRGTAARPRGFFGVEVVAVVAAAAAAAALGVACIEASVRRCFDCLGVGEEDIAGCGGVFLYCAYVCVWFLTKRHKTLLHLCTAVGGRVCRHTHHFCWVGRGDIQ